MLVFSYTKYSFNRLSLIPAVRRGSWLPDRCEFQDKSRLLWQRVFWQLDRYFWRCLCTDGSWFCFLGRICIWEGFFWWGFSCIFRDVWQGSVFIIIYCKIFNRWREWPCREPFHLWIYIALAFALIL